MCESSSNIYINSSCGKDGIPSMRICTSKTSPQSICAQSNSFIDHSLSNFFFFSLGVGEHIVLTAKVL